MNKLFGLVALSASLVSCSQGLEASSSSASHSAPAVIASALSTPLEVMRNPEVQTAEHDASPPLGLMAAPVPADDWERGPLPVPKRSLPGPVMMDPALQKPSPLAQMPVVLQSFD